MANEICAAGFTGTLNSVNGTYALMYKDHWTNGTYWIYRDSYYWMISDSEFLHESAHTVAIRRCIDQNTQLSLWVDGDYYTPETSSFSIGYFISNPPPTKIGTISLGIC